MLKNNISCSLSGQFFGGCIFILSAAAVCAAITVNIYCHDPEDNIPALIRVLFLKTIAPCLMVSIVQKSQDRRQSKNYPQDKDVNGKDNNVSSPVLIETTLCNNSRDILASATRLTPNDWNNLATVLDRLFLIIFTITIIVVSVLILTRRPEILAKPWELWPNEAVFH